MYKFNQNLMPNATVCSRNFLKITMQTFTFQYDIQEQQNSSTYESGYTWHSCINVKNIFRTKILPVLYYKYMK